MPKRRTRKILRGGAWYNPMDWFSSDSTAPKRSWSDWWNSTTSSAESTLSAANPFSYTPPSNPMPPAPAPAPMPEPTFQSVEEEPQQLGPVGGRRRRRKHSRKHSKKGGSLASTAETVSNTKTAVPTYWIKGGRRTRRHRKH
jgi:hypothetical protein